MADSHYVWVLGSDGEPLSTEGPFGPYSLQSAKTYARIAATEGAHDRAVSAGGADPLAAGFKVIRVYKAGTGEHTVKDVRYADNPIPSSGWLIAIHGRGYETESYGTRAGAEQAAQELANRTGRTVELIRIQNHGADRFIIAEIEPDGYEDNAGTLPDVPWATLSAGDVVQFRYEPGTGGVILSIAPGGTDPRFREGRASVQTRGGVREVPIDALRRVRPEHEERVRRSALGEYNANDGRIGVPYRLSYAHTYTGKERDTKPGRGEAGWTVAYFTTEEKARAFLESLPEESWMPGTERLAKKWGVQPRYYDNRWGRSDKPKPPPRIRPEVRQAMSAAIRGDIEGARRDVSRAAGGMTPAERNAFADAMMLNPSDVDQYQARVEMAHGEEPHDPGIPGLSVVRSGHPGEVMLVGSYSAIMEALCDVMGLSVDEAEEYIEPRYENNARSAAERPVGSVENFSFILTGLLTQYDQRESAKEIQRSGHANTYRLAHLLGAADQAREKASLELGGELQRHDAKAINAYVTALSDEFVFERGRFALAPINRLHKMMTDWLMRGKSPNYPVARSA